MQTVCCHQSCAFRPADDSAPQNMAVCPAAVLHNERLHSHSKPEAPGSKGGHNSACTRTTSAWACLAPSIGLVPRSPGRSHVLNSAHSIVCPGNAAFPAQIKPALADASCCMRMGHGSSGSLLLCCSPRSRAAELMLKTVPGIASLRRSHPRQQSAMPRSSSGSALPLSSARDVHTWGSQRMLCRSQAAVGMPRAVTSSGGTSARR